MYLFQGKFCQDSISEDKLLEKVSEYKEKEYDRLAKIFEENIDINKIEDILNLK